MRKLVCNLLIFFIIILCSCSNEIKYEVLPEMVDEVEIISSEESIYSLVILLKEESKKEFEEITRNNVGEKMSIILFDEEVLNSKINAPITSGTIKIGNWNDKAIAEKYLYRILKE
ncbi:MAG: hypothetical protein PVH88_22940 [Ignavibacteria bacterium]